MEITCYALYEKFYVLSSGLDEEAKDLMRQLGGKIDEDGDFFWEKDRDPLYYIIYQLTKSYTLEIK